MPDDHRLDGVSGSRTYPDGTVVRVSIRRTDDSTYPSGWRYTLHYGALDPDTPGTLPDGTILRYDNAHEDTNGHERHAPSDPKPEKLEFSGMDDLWDQFWCAVPKTEFDLETEE